MRIKKEQNLFPFLKKKVGGHFRFCGHIVFYDYKEEEGLTDNVKENIRQF